MIRWWTNPIYITKKKTRGMFLGDFVPFSSFTFGFEITKKWRLIRLNEVRAILFRRSFRSYMCTPAPNEIFRGWLEKMMTFKGFEISSYTTCKLFLLILVEWIFGRRFSSFKRINFFLAKKLCSFATCNLKKKYNDFLRKHVH